MVHLAEDRKKAVGLACLLKIECVNRRCKQPNCANDQKCGSFYKTN